jgi:hypothetical protein
MVTLKKVQAEIKMSGVKEPLRKAIYYRGQFNSTIHAQETILGSNSVFDHPITSLINFLLLQMLS